MSINASQFREYIVRAPLQLVKLWSADAEELLMMTAAQESHLGEFLRQVGSGPALGIYQMEPATHADCWRYITQKHVPNLPWAWQQTGDTLIWNLQYATVMCRIKYLEIPTAIPAATNIDGLAWYWKHWYNSDLGSGTAQEAIENYHRYVKP